MSETCEVVRVVCPVVKGNQHGFMEINKSDFKEGEHELYGVQDTEESLDQFNAMNREELKECLNAAGIEYASATGDKKLRALCREASAK